MEASYQMSVMEHELALEEECEEELGTLPGGMSATLGAIDAVRTLSALGSPLPRRTEKPWGHEMLWIASPRYAAKILHIEAGRRLSLQYHERKEETLLLVRGRMALDLESQEGVMERHEARPGEYFHILPGQKHRLAAMETCDVLEVSTAELEDVVRVQDDFGRS